MKSLIIIPAYNEEKNIISVVKDIEKFASEFDYIIVNDCSTDDTYNVCVKNGFNVINLPVNLGIGGAMQTGYKFAKKYNYDVAVQFDGDGQHDAKYLNKLMDDMIKNNSDMVIGSRFIKNEGFQSSKLRRIGINFFSFLFKFLYNIKISDTTSGLRMVNSKIISMFCDYYPKDYPEPETTAICIRNGYKVNEIPVIMKEREHGVSSINFIKSIYYMIKVTLAILIDCTKGKMKNDK